MTGTVSRRGRPPIPADQAREVSLKCLAQATLFRLPTAAIARIHDCSVRAVQLRIKRARAYPEARDPQTLAAHFAN